VSSSQGGAVTLAGGGEEGRRELWESRELRLGRDLRRAIGGDLCVCVCRVRVREREVQSAKMGGYEHREMSIEMSREMSREISVL
jgi:hypothetical protein